VKILVIGATGMLGFALYKVLGDQGWDVEGTIGNVQPPTYPSCSRLKYICSVSVEDTKSIADAISLVILPGSRFAQK